MAYGTPYVRMALKKLVVTIGSAQMTHLSSWTVCIRLAKGLHEPIRHYRVLPWAMRPLTLPECMAKVIDWEVTKTGKSSIFFLLSSLSVYINQASTIMAKAIRTIRTPQNSIKHWVLDSLLIVRTWTILQWFWSTLMLILSTIRHFVRTTLFIAYTLPAGSSTEYVFRYSLPWKIKMATANVR